MLKIYVHLWVEKPYEDVELLNMPETELEGYLRNRVEELRNSSAEEKELQIDTYNSLVVDIFRLFVAEGFIDYNELCLFLNGLRVPAGMYCLSIPVNEFGAVCCNLLDSDVSSVWETSNVSLQVAERILIAASKKRKNKHKNQDSGI